MFYVIAFCWLGPVSLSRSESQKLGAFVFAFLVLETPSHLLLPLTCLFYFIIGDRTNSSPHIPNHPSPVKTSSRNTQPMTVTNPWILLQMLVAFADLINPPRSLL